MSAPGGPTRRARGPEGQVGTRPPGRARAPRACLVVLDGWGLAEPGPGNAVSLAHTPVFDELWSTYPHTTLTACGRAVGLPEGQMGNSEVGHLNLGAGAIVKQDLVRIDEAIADGSLAESQVLRAAFEGETGSTAAGVGEGPLDGAVGLRGSQPMSAGTAGGPAGPPPRVHLLGLVSDGGVHSSLEHLRALIALAGEIAPSADVVVHAFTDGRDTLPHAGAGYLAGSTARRARAWGWSSAATGRWTATAAGSARSALTTCSFTNGRPITPTVARRPCGRRTSGARQTSSSSRRSSARRRAFGLATACSASTFAPTACVRSSGRLPSPVSGKLVRAARLGPRERLPGGPQVRPRTTLRRG